MSNNILDVDSSYRERAQYPLPADFVVLLAPAFASPPDGPHAVDPVSEQVVLYPPEYPFGPYNTQLETISYYAHTPSYISEQTLVYSRLYLPYMFSVTNTVMRIEPLPFANTDPDDVDNITLAAELTEGYVPLDRWNNAYVGDVVEHMISGEFVEIASSEYTTDATVLQGAVFIAWNPIDLTLVAIAQNNEPALSTVPEFYVGKYLSISDNEYRIKRYYLNDNNLPTFKLASPLSAVPESYADIQIVAHENWFITLSEAFNTSVPAYPAYLGDTVSIVEYTSYPVPQGESYNISTLPIQTIFAISLVRLTEDDRIGVFYTSALGLWYQYSSDSEGSAWSSTVSLRKWSTMPDYIETNTIGACIINSRPACAYIAAGTFGYYYGDDALGTNFAEQTSVYNLVPYTRIAMQPIPSAGISGFAGTDAGFPEIAFTNLATNLLSVLRATDFAGTGWTLTALDRSGNVVDFVSHLGTVIATSTILNTRSNVVFKYLEAGVGVGADATTLGVDEGGGVVDVAITDGFYENVEDIAQAIEDALNASGGLAETYTVSVAAGVFTIAATGAFVLDDGSTDSIMTELGFTVLPTASAVSQVGDTVNSLAVIEEGSLGEIGRNPANTAWVYSDALQDIGAVTGIPSICEATTFIRPVGITDRETIFLCIAFIKDAVLKARYEKYITSGGEAYATFELAPIIALDELTATDTITAFADYTGDSNYNPNIPTLANNIYVTVTYYRENIVRNCEFTLNIVAPNVPYDIGAFANAGPIAAIPNVDNTAPFLFMEYLSLYARALSPELTVSATSVPYRLRKQAPRLQEDATTAILSGTTTTVTLSSGLGLNTEEDFYVGSFLYLYNTATIPRPATTELWNEVVRITAYSGAAGSPAYTFTVYPALPSAPTALVRNYVIDIETGWNTIRYGSTLYTIATGEYADVQDVLDAINAAVAVTLFEFDGEFVFVDLASRSGIFMTYLLVSLGFREPVLTVGTVTAEFPAVFTNVGYIELLDFAHDNYSPMVYNGTRLQEIVCYQVNLVSLILPNITLSVGYGSRIAFYPYVYVEFINLTAQAQNLFYSNNPHSSYAMFKVPITNIVDPSRSTFVSLNGPSMGQILPFNPNSQFKVRILLPNGEVFQTLETDTPPPYPPNPNLQVSLTLSVRRVDYSAQNQC